MADSTLLDLVLLSLLKRLQIPKLIVNEIVFEIEVLLFQKTP